MVAFNINKIEKDVAVVIPVFNRPTIVIETLESIAAQTILPGKVIVVDDGSTDNTAKVVKKWIEENDTQQNISLISTENHGASAARNHGLNILKEYEYVAFLDSDDKWPENFVERMTQSLRENSNAVAVSCDRFCIDNIEHSKSLFQVASLQYDPIAFMLKRGAGLLSCSIFRRKFLYEAGTFDEKILTGEDSALLLPLALLGPWLYLPIDPVICITHNIHDEEMNKHDKYPDAMLIWSNIYDAFISQVDTKYPKLRKWKLILSSRWFISGLILINKIRIRASLYCFSRTLFWVFSSFKH
jgi:glycosyltransferase involved in cell wall biosynthesis